MTDQPEEYVASQEMKDMLVADWRAWWLSRPPEQVEYDREMVAGLRVDRGRKR